MRMRNVFILLVSLFVAQGAFAQDSRQNTLQVLKNYADSIKILRHRLDSIQQENDSLRKKVEADGRYYRLFAPTTFYRSGVNKSLSMNPESGESTPSRLGEGYREPSRQGWLSA